MSTFIDGIGASQNIDSSGETIMIDGMDISSLDKSGVFNYEHKMDTPAQIVGKILKAKKIFSEKDCEDDRQLMFWKKCQVPFIYVMGELMDDYKQSAKEVAGMFRYDADREGTQAVDVVGFSIEGSYLKREGNLVTRSVARKCTITTASCNKMALAKMVVIDKKIKKDEIDELFKTEFSSTAVVLKKDEGFGSIGEPSSPFLALSEELKKTTTISAVPPVNPLGSKIGTVGQHSVMSHAKPLHYGSLGSKDLRSIANTHFSAGEAAGQAGNAKMRQHHTNMTGFFMQAADRAESRENTPRQKMAMPHSGPKITHTFDPRISGKMKPPGPIAKSELAESTTDEESNDLMNRTEDKYFISRSALDYLTQVIKENLKEGDIDTEVRYNTNRSIYLDNIDLDSLKDAMNGVKPRIKIRIRQYAPNHNDWEKVAYVEIKAKSKDSTKIRIRIHAHDIEGFLEGNPIIMSEDLANINKDINKQLLEKRIRLLNHLISMYGYRKQVEVQYERRAYTSKNVRITIDENLRFSKAKPISDENTLAIKCTEGWVNILQLQNKLENEGFLILEVKYQGETPKWVKKALENANAQRVHFSKYCGAMSCVIETKLTEGFIGAATALRDNSLNKALDAGSGMAAPSQLVGGAALGKESLEKKKSKSKWLTRAETEYSNWHKREQFESFMAKRMPHLTKGEVKAIGQVMALNKSMTLEKALSSLSGFSELKPKIASADPLNKSAGKNSIFTLILFDGCDLYDILHCSHFATDEVDNFEKIKAVCDAYFSGDVKSHELKFNDAGKLGKHDQPVLFLSGGDPYRDLHEKLKEVAKYKYEQFRPHISVTSNVDEFKGKASCIVISVNGEIKKRYDLK